MIKETYCSYEVSKLLKKKGFDGDGGDCECHMFYCEYTEERIMPICEIGLVPDNEEVFFAPTHQMAMTWLREKGILLWVYPAICLNAEDNRTFHWMWDGKKQRHDARHFGDQRSYNTYEKAEEAALKYTLSNIIKT